MNAEYIQRGESLDYKNETAKQINAGEVVVFGTRIGIAGTTIPLAQRGAYIWWVCLKYQRKTEKQLRRSNRILFGRWTDSHCGRGTECTGGRICG